MWLQAPVLASQESVVQRSLSSQLIATPPTQAPFVQYSPVVHALLSLQAMDVTIGKQ